jgi:hypothetical protein
MKNDMQKIDWLNRATWLVASWLGNEHGRHAYWRDVTRELWQNSRTLPLVKEWNWPHRDAVRLTLATRIRDEVVEAAPTAAANLFSDLLNDTLAVVAWLEIADACLVKVAGDEGRSQDGIHQLPVIMKPASPIVWRIQRFAKQPGVAP